MMEELWQSYCLKIRHYIAKHVSDQYEAEDLLQEVALRFLQQYEEGSSIENMEAWLFKVTKGIIVDYYRKKNRVYPVEEVQASALTFQENLMEENFNKETADCLKELIGCMSPEDQKALVESDLKGKQQKQLAEEWQLSYSGGKNRVQRARKKLKKELLNCCQVKLDNSGNVILFKEERKKCGSFSILPRLNK